MTKSAKEETEGIWVEQMGHEELPRAASGICSLEGAGRQQVAEGEPPSISRVQLAKGVSQEGRLSLQAVNR